MRRLAAILLTTLAIALSSEVAANEPRDRVVSALQASLTANVEHARNWLDMKDYKSLAQSAGGLEYLAEVLAAQSDDAAWQQARSVVVSKTNELQSVAVAGDEAGCRKIFAELEAATGQFVQLRPTGKSKALPRARGVRPLMLLMDGVYADAKIAVLTGNADKAKNNAYVLSELARVVSNSRNSDSRNGDGWQEMSDDLRQASLTAAQNTSNDPNELRKLLRGISESCQSCHDAR